MGKLKLLINPIVDVTNTKNFVYVLLVFYYAHMNFIYVISQIIITT